MKNYYKFSTILLTGLLFTFLLSTNAQKINNFRPVWQSKTNSLKAFIENKEQFADINEKKILFVFIADNEKFYFTNNGFIIKIDTVLYRKPLAKKLKGIFSKEKEDRENFKIKSYYLYSEW